MLNNKEAIQAFVRLGLKIENSLRFSNFLSIYSYERLFNEYASFFISPKTNRFFEKTTDNDIINLILFDKKISSDLLRWLLFLETKLKKVTVEKWKEKYGHYSDKLYAWDNESLLKTIPNIVNCSDLEFKKFKYSLFELVSNSEYLQKYNNLKDIPIENLSYSWSFATIINFYRVLDDSLKQQIVKTFNIPIDFINSFDRVFSIFLKIRNIISHNHVLYNFKTNIFRIEFNNLYQLLFKREEKINFNNPINLYQCIMFIDYLLNWNYAKKNFEKYMKDLILLEDAKIKLIQSFFGM